MAYLFDEFELDEQDFRLLHRGRRVALEPKALRVLIVLVKAKGKLISKGAILEEVWKGTFVDETTLIRSIALLRKSLGDDRRQPRFIETVPTIGYRFIAKVTVESQPDLDASIRGAAPKSDDHTDEKPPRRSQFSVKVLSIGIALAVLATILVVVLRHKTKASEDLHSIAVLPLSTQGNKTEYDVADGMTDSIINDLSLVPNLRVISHASVFQYRNQGVEPRAVGNKLGVGAVLTGRLEESGSNVSVNLELTATSDGRHLWGKQYSRNTSERTGMALEIADAVSNAMRLNLTALQRQDIGNQNASDAEAHQLYLKGRYYFFRETPDDVLDARRLFQEAIDRDPNFALAYAALGDTYDWMAIEGYQPLSEVESESAAAKNKANELNNSSAEIHTSQAGHAMAQGNWPKVDAELQTALQINPNYFEAHRLYSIYLRTMRRFPEAIQHAKLCDELNPLMISAKSHLALTYYYARQYDAAAEEYRLLLKDEPERPGAHLGLSSVLIKMGKEKEAIDEWQKALTLSGNEAVARELGRTYAKSGLLAAQEERLRDELRVMTRNQERTYISPVEFAYRFALLDDKDAAFRWLEKAYVERSPQLLNVNVDPDYDNLRSDARYQDLVSRLHFPQ